MITADILDHLQPGQCHREKHFHSIYHTWVFWPPTSSSPGKDVKQSFCFAMWLAVPESGPTSGLERTMFLSCVLLLVSNTRGPSSIAYWRLSVKLQHLKCFSNGDKQPCISPESVSGLVGPRLGWTNITNSLDGFVVAILSHQLIAWFSWDWRKQCTNILPPWASPMEASYD